VTEAAEAISAEHSRPSAGAVVLHAAGREPPRWSGRAGGRVVPLASASHDVHARAAIPSVEQALGDVDCVLVDATSLDPLAIARRVHQVDADVQVVVVAESEERRRALASGVLFTPGVGELWIASPADVTGAIAERAAGVTRQRRKYRRTRERIERDHITSSPQRSERALISDAYLADLLEVLPDPVFSVGPSGRILSANRAAGHLAAAAGHSLVGLQLDAVVRPYAPSSSGKPSSMLELLSGAAREPRNAEVTFRLDDGSTGRGELLVVRVAGSDPALFAVVLHDLTERYAAQQQLEDQANELEEQAAELEQVNDELLHQRADLESALSSRSRFYAAMNHELRTPINAIIGYIGLALEGVYGPISQDLSDALVRSQRAASHLHELVDDVLDLAKIEAGRIELKKEGVDISALVEDILLSVRPSAAEHGTSVILECDDDPPIRTVTDPRRVRQILLNLLSNALKFSDGLPITLRCAVVSGDVALSVADRGPGIPESEQEKIFEEFVQLAPGEHRGTGLGLAISRRLAELLGGRLTVSSEVGGGSTFTLVLPGE
jgi:PAS domain S-box-containing protein